jgi:hypothetical protein
MLDPRMHNRLVVSISSLTLYARRYSKSVRPFLVASAIVLSSLLGSRQAEAQSVIVPTVATGFLVGPVGGINLVAYSTGTVSLLNSEPTCFTAQNGSGIAPWGGISLEYPLGNPNELQNFIIGEVLYDSKSSDFTVQNGGAVGGIPTKQNGFTATGAVQTALSATLNYVLINLMYKYNFTPAPSPVGPGFQVGPSVGILLSSKLNQTATVTAVNPAGPQGETQSATLTNAGTDTSAQTIRIALRAQATYDLPLTEDWIMTPTVGYDFPITKVDNSYRNWRASALFGGIAFRYFIKG